MCIPFIHLVSLPVHVPTFWQYLNELPSNLNPGLQVKVQMSTSVKFPPATGVHFFFPLLGAGSSGHLDTEIKVKEYKLII